MAQRDPGVHHQIVQKVERFRGEMDGKAGLPDHAPGRVQFNLADLDHCRHVQNTPVSPADGGTQTGGKLPVSRTAS